MGPTPGETWQDYANGSVPHYNEWTSEFFAELDRRGDPGRFDRAKAPIIMELLKRQLLSPRYIQHSARVLFVVGQASDAERP